ncbi:ficolin-3-like [Ruditapes philippinarum]|uniref:ficolin-3-like n=1 Tax=Ruditapes philippinarum TaxID=129788 RepID=UPI00295C1745|nr:ficolin-3-like [Ruditapes philippinarum]
MITRQGWYELHIDIVSPENEVAHALYNVFYVGDAQTQYELLVDEYSGTAGDSLGSHNGQKFTTKDRDNDPYESNCAVQFIGAWWYEKGHSSNLNGDYGNTQYAKGYTSNFVMSRQVGVKRRAYDQSMVDQAAEVVRSGSMSLCGASKLYKIPKTTLHDRVKNKYASSKIGVKTVLSLEEETRLEKWALHMSRIGNERTRKELADVNSCKKNH